MKLKALHAGRLPGELHADLTAYAEYYHKVLSESIAVWPLVVQILRTFVDSDRAFQAWRRQHRRNGAARSHVQAREMRANG